jgi:hypothetical protein
MWYNAPAMQPAGNLDEVELEFFHLIQLTSRLHRR